ncbi:nucleotide-binding alpha-beta plait domain-containing protein, partial [Tanacetum coccineum]
TTSCDLWLSLKKAYAPHSTSREYTLKTQLLSIKIHGNETPDAYLNRTQEYADALAAIGEPVKDKDLIMLVVSGLREEYNGLKLALHAWFECLSKALFDLGFKGSKTDPSLFIYSRGDALLYIRHHCYM